MLLRSDHARRLATLLSAAVFIAALWLLLSSLAEGGVGTDRTHAQETHQEPYGPFIERMGPDIPHDLACTQATVPVLMYHHVRGCPAGSACDPRQHPIAYQLSVEPALFEQQMAYLREAGYSSILPQRLASGPVPCGSVVITFDDGYADNYWEAFPILQRYGMQGGFAIITDRIGREDYLDQAQLAALRDAGHEILSHSVTHPNLTSLSDEELLDELRRSREALEQALALTIRSMVYPAGRHNARVVAATREAGYLAGFTTESGDADTLGDPLRLRRLRVSNTQHADFSQVFPRRAD